MCDDPNCGRCNAEAKEKITEAGLGLGSKILALLLEYADEHDIKPNDRDDAYFFIESTQVGLIKAFLGVVHSVSSQELQDKTVEQFLANVAVMAKTMREHNSSGAGSGTTLH